MTQTYNKTEPIIIEEIESAELSLFFSRLSRKIAKLWPWIIISSLISVFLVFAFLKLTSSQYNIHASLLVQDDQKGSGMGDMSLLQDFGLLAGKSNVDNEAEILKSRSLMEKVGDKLNLPVFYSIKGKFKATEIFEQRPVDLQFISSSPELTEMPLAYTIRIDPKDRHRFFLTDNSKSFTASLGDTLKLQEGKIILQQGPGFFSWPADHDLLVSVLPRDQVIQDLLNSLVIEIPNKQVSVVYLTMTNTLPRKGAAILNALLFQYLQGSVNDKNRIAESTIDFINNRLSLVTDELAGVEKELETFKTTNKLTDITEQSRIMLENTSEYAKQQTTQEVSLSVVEGLEQFLKDNKDNNRVVPSSLVMQDMSFITIIDRYNQTKLERDKMLMSLTTAHPTILTLDQQLANLRLELLSSISSIKKGIMVSISELRKRTSGFAGEISKVPSKERVYLDISRQQAIKQELYVFLLKKREETAITKSANVANASIIDNAKAEPLPFKPKKFLLFLGGLLAGMFLPFAISFGLDALNTRVTSMRDITSLTNVPVLCEIGHKEGEAHIVRADSRDVISEQIRAMRTNLQYLVAGKIEKTIMITSSMSGEGKTFLGINLCTVLALAGKKVILLELDLRKPKVTKQLNLKVSGYTNYIISNDNNWSAWIQPSGLHENFQVMASGPIPPNPTELLLLPKTMQMLKDLSKHFDYVVMDTPPAGLVTDAEILASAADVTLYMVRDKVTFKEQIKLINRFYNKKVFPHLNLVLNDVSFDNKGYGYGYGYGYGNYSEEEKSGKKKIRSS